MAAASADPSPSGQSFFSVKPKLDCPHLQAVIDGSQKVGVDVKEPCGECGNIGENWLCLSCAGVYCSRYVQGHMVKHNEKDGHPIVISYADISVWCYSCDSYIDSPLLRPIIQVVTSVKFRGL